MTANRLQDAAAWDSLGLVSESRASLCDTQVQSVPEYLHGDSLDHATVPGTHKTLVNAISKGHVLVCVSLYKCINVLRGFLIDVFLHLLIKKMRDWEQAIFLLSRFNVLWFSADVGSQE